MPRRPNIDRPTRLELKLPESLRAKLDLHLFSEVEGRVPKGGYQAFFEQRIREFFTPPQGAFPDTEADGVVFCGKCGKVK
jgi:hypothetical protein